MKINSKRSRYCQKRFCTDLHLWRTLWDFQKIFCGGTATASYQIECAWNEDGKVPSVWDAFCHDGSHIKNADNSDTACDHYHRYKDDVALMASFGLKAYRFSIR